MQGLTDRQQQCLDLITTSVRNRGYPPTMRELGAAMGVRSTNGVNDHLRALERKGKIQRNGGASRGISVVGLVAPTQPSDPPEASGSGPLTCAVHNRPMGDDGRCSYARLLRGGHTARPCEAQAYNPGRATTPTPKSVLNLSAEHLDVLRRTRDAAAEEDHHGDMRDAPLAAVLTLILGDADDPAARCLTALGRSDATDEWLAQKTQLPIETVRVTMLALQDQGRVNAVGPGPLWRRANRG